MTSNLVRVRREAYVDSVLLMLVTRTMQEAGDVAFAAALMGTPANLESLAGRGFGEGDLRGVGANDVVLAVQAASPEGAEEALQVGEATLGEQARAGEAPGAPAAPRTLEEAALALPGANLALVSVPGEYAALEAHKALSLGLHVLLFSDNVPLEDEVELKSRAARLGLLVMGPGAGTAMLGGTGLGFANAARRGPVGVVAAAGTGAQEVMSLLDRWGSGVSEVVGVGGRDLSSPVGGTMARSAIRALEGDARTEVLLVVSKPPARDVATAVLGSLGKKPAVAALIGAGEDLEPPPGARLARTLEGAVLRTLELLGREVPQPWLGLARVVADAGARLPQPRRGIRGFFSGGTLCYEAMVLLSERLGPVHSNVPLDPGWALPAPEAAHVCLDLGEEEFTRGRPHPMIDPEARTEAILRAADDPTTAVILLDVVLGFGAHPDPASVLAPACREVASRPDAPAVVAYVLGTDGDPQDLGDQRGQLEEAGCLLAPTGTRAALMAAALAARRPELAEEVA